MGGAGWHTVVFSVVVLSLGTMHTVFSGLVCKENHSKQPRRSSRVLHLGSSARQIQPNLSLGQVELTTWLASFKYQPTRKFLYQPRKWLFWQPARKLSVDPWVQLCFHNTVHPNKYAHGSWFTLFWFSYVMLNFTNILQGCFTATGAITWFLQCRWSQNQDCVLIGPKK